MTKRSAREIPWGKMAFKPLLVIIAVVIIGGFAVLFACGTSSTKSAHTEPTSPPATANQSSASDGQLVPPEIVRCKEMHVSDGVKTIIMSNANGDYHLSCSTKAGGCLTPAPGVPYFLFNDKTRWKMPGAKTVLDLAFMQDWTVTYNKGENIGLIPQDPDARAGGLGMYMLDSWNSAEHSTK